MSYKKKMLYILGSILSLVIVFYVFKKDIFYWSCYEEDVYSSCHILAGYLEEEKQHRLALDHLHRACDDGKYPLSCKKLSDLYLESNPEKSKHYIEKTCKLDEDFQFCKKGRP